MNDNGKPIPIIRNRRNNAISQSRSGDSATRFRPRDLTLDKLRGLNHAEWLEDFSKILALSTGVEMTAKREGTITRLHWAADYVKLLEQELRDRKVEHDKVAVHCDRLERDLTRALAALDHHLKGANNVD